MGLCQLPSCHCPCAAAGLWLPCPPGRADWTPLCSCGDVPLPCVCVTERGSGDRPFVSHKQARGPFLSLPSKDILGSENVEKKEMCRLSGLVFWGYIQ